MIFIKIQFKDFTPYVLHIWLKYTILFFVNIQTMFRFVRTNFRHVHEFAFEVRFLFCIRIVFFFAMFSRLLWTSRNILFCTCCSEFNVISFSVKFNKLSISANPLFSYVTTTCSIKMINVDSHFNFFDICFEERVMYSVTDEYIFDK